MARTYLYEAADAVMTRKISGSDLRAWACAIAERAGPIERLSGGSETSSGSTEVTMTIASETCMRCIQCYPNNLYVGCFLAAAKTSACHSDSVWLPPTRPQVAKR
ncbi:hypothetical protein ACC756_26115 [Rhizobium ruizarguesonis]